MQPIAKTLSIILMRHGRSLADDENVHEGWYDSPLTDIGQSQAEQRGKYFKDRKFKFDCIISSSFLRASRTAQIVGQMINANVEMDADWKEINNGPLAGLSIEFAANKYPEPDFRNPYEPYWGTGESNWEAYCRAAKAIEKVIRRGPGSYLVVSHGGILNHAMRTIVGVQPPINWQGVIFSFGDTGYFRMEYRISSHQWILREFQSG